MIGCSHMPDPRKLTDNYLWLEEISSEKSLNWVEEQNGESLSILESDSRYNSLYSDLIKIFEDPDKIPSGTFRGGFVYNFWRDATHVQGLWRRTTLSEYKKDKPNWETLLDFDTLSKAENKTLVYKGVECLTPDYNRCMIRISNGGTDAAELREFDVSTKTFVSESPFFVPEAKSRSEWVDKDTLLVGSNWGPGSLTDSGYPRLVRLWKRGESLEKSPIIFAGDEKDVSVGAWKPESEDVRHIILYRALDFYNYEFNLFDPKSGKISKIDLPSHIDIDTIFKGQIVLRNKKDWSPSSPYKLSEDFVKAMPSKLIPAGSLFSMELNSLIDSKKEITIQSVWTPSERSSLDSLQETKSRLVLNISNNVKSEIYYADFTNNKWSTKSTTAPQNGSIRIFGSNPQSELMFLSFENFLTPETLYLLDTKSEKMTPVKKQKTLFNSDDLVLHQKMATSADGEQIPFFAVHKKGIKRDGSNPTLIYGYGGFETSLTPWYSGSTGKSWLEKGGVYVIANIRGGGEFGPKWHQAALKMNRQTAFNDFHAVAEELIKMKVTSPKKIGISGGSNGGLLVGAAFTQRPELYEAVVCSVPLLDMLRYHKLLAGASWMAEYGNPDDKKMAQYLYGYSPYHNISKEKKYPEVFFMTSTKDDRVHPGHARKMVAKMKDQGHKVFYFENTEGGHAGAANLKQSAKRLTLQYIYLYKKLMDD